ncbi:hypothetical protein SERLADRAFT_466398 [Serpula lacrymans var. lacrymans S7.9]|uniref:Uncharacterized protein n=1 Tax=Serpula lacrymans var. lacrymans (strain S7.9) TaxID=578457 RepID=F8NU19_SERL9|nr:uncharacterized protein SERLADRAFT_466398 [Serpula lacrymans var. lacrymans S7.9]EGO25785.1 hypothetical protein SERLADRAFT_466398 [Serpula lacrymans var. lacrymans S7.9]
MSIKSMTDLAELQLHLRDEHVHLGILKQKLRKCQILSMSTNDFTLGEAEPASNPGHPPDNSNSEAEALHSPSSTCGNSMDDIIIDEDPEVVTFGQIHVSISQLFNFEDTAWIQELELYDLVSLDAPGELDESLDMDTFKESVLTSAP